MWKVGYSHDTPPPFASSKSRQGSCRGRPRPSSDSASVTSRQSSRSRFDRPTCSSASLLPPRPRCARCRRGRRTPAPPPATGGSAPAHPARRAAPPATATPRPSGGQVSGYSQLFAGRESAHRTALPAARRSSRAWWRDRFVAATFGPPFRNRRPSKSVTRPPASRTINSPAAVSQARRASSQNPSRRPAATEQRSKAAEPARRTARTRRITWQKSFNARSIAGPV